MATDRLQIRLDAIDNTKRAFSSVKSSIFSLRGALATLGLGLVIKSFIDTGKSVENLQVRLKGLFGSAKEGAKAFDVMTKFAARVPFSLEEIQAASGNLAVVAGNADNLAEILDITGNVAALTGIDFKTAGEQIQRAFSGGIAAADIFREKGVRDMLGFKQGATVTADETIKAFQRVFGKGGQFGNQTAELANTFTGTLSMLGDKLFGFKSTVAGAGFFDELKKEFKSLNEFIEKNSKDIEAIGKFISEILTLAVKAFAGAVELVVISVKKLREGMRELEKFDFSDMSEGLGQISDTTKRINDEFNNVPENLEPIKTKTNEIKGNLGDHRNIIEKISDELKSVNEKFRLEAEIVKGVQSAAKGVSTAIAESIVLGKKLNDSFRVLAGQILVNVISKMIERRLLLLAELALEKLKTSELAKQVGFMKTMAAISRATGISGFFGGLFGGGAYGGTGAGDLIVGSSGMLGGGVAEGGSVKGGVPYTVGERGRELFVPDTNGTIVKNEDLGNIGGANITFNINAVDVTGVQELLIQNRSTITNLINQALNQRGKAALV